MMNILFTDTGWNQYTEWQGQDKKTVKRINQLLKSIDRDGAMQGIGKPELLKYNKSGLYSRRIDETNRLVYEISGNQIIVKSCKGHYED
ncbi:MAG TPA: Txe/YoeB family addiction module toxin [Lachnospiraceae bacterium]|nr:Txe/YoeB family addiction module toxin [Lachnospiraceae bacterium]